MTPNNLITEGKQITQFFSNTSGVWSSNAGGLYINPQGTDPYVGQEISTVYLRAANKTFGGNISRGADTGSVSITGIFPAPYCYPTEMEPDIPGCVIDMKRDGSIIGRELGDGLLRREYKLAMQNNTAANYLEFEEFWRHHFPMLPLKFIDYMLDLNLMIQLISRPKITYRSHNRINYEVMARQVL